ncbi:MAG TPA: lysophospholipid transporter LplT [Steroidobacteraceae bacterium]
MNRHNAPSPDTVAPLWTRGMVGVLIAQFLSAMADNALLFGALALLRLDRYPDWAAPVLQEFFVGAFIVLAPFVGPFADTLPKGRVMFISNALKLAGALAMCLGLNPFLAYGLVGIGAAAYSPAKYGILSELTSPARLVQANGLLESSTIAAILIGAILGGVLADWNVIGALVVVSACYGLAAAANLLIPRLPPAHPLNRFSPIAVLRDFGRALGSLFRIPDAQFSIAGTSIFWGAGVTLRFLLVAWVPAALGIAGNAMPAYLNGMVAVGIVIGAACAAKFITLTKADRVMPAGVLIGLAVCLLAGTRAVPVAFAIVALVGACGGFFVVPLNALLQDRGHSSVGAGHAVAVQNLVENAAMLVMLGLYTLAVRTGAPISGIAGVFGVFLSVALTIVWIIRLRQVRIREVSRQPG